MSSDRTDGRTTVLESVPAMAVAIEVASGQ